MAAHGLIIAWFGGPFGPLSTTTRSPHADRGIPLARSSYPARTDSIRSAIGTRSDVVAFVSSTTLAPSVA